MFEKHGIATPRGVVVRRGDDVAQAYRDLGVRDVVVKAQILSGKRGKNNGIRFCSDAEDAKRAASDMFASAIRGQYVASVLMEEKLDIAEEQYLSLTYNTKEKQPIAMYSKRGGMDIEDVPADDIQKRMLDVREASLASEIPFMREVWNCFLGEDCRLLEINPLLKTPDGRWIAADAKIAIDGDAFFRHEEWKELEPRSPLGRLPTERELRVKKIDEGDAYYRGTAGKYIEMDGDIAILFSGGGASIANMDALIRAGLRPANYTEYSGNPPREKVRDLAAIVLSKPGLRGLWIAGGVANFTNIAETFQGIVDALDEVKPAYPIVVRRAGPYEEEGMRIMRECAKRNHLPMKLFGKETTMSDTAEVLAEMVGRG